MDLQIFFNPYCDAIRDKILAKARLVAAAKACYELSKSQRMKMYDFSGIDSFRFVIITREDLGAGFTASSLIHEFEGRDKDLIIWFCIQFDKGTRIEEGRLATSSGWLLRESELPVPALGYALNQNGIAVTVSDDTDWLLDFFELVHEESRNEQRCLPNVYGQDRLDVILSWIKDWKRINLNFEQYLYEEFGVTFCPGSTNYSYPNEFEKTNVIKSFEEAKVLSYCVDGNTVKSFSTKYGCIFELRSYSDGFRVFYALKDGKPVIGGFYKKSGALSQNKAGENAAGRLSEKNYI